MSKTKPVPAGSAAKLREIECRKLRDKAARAVSVIYRRTACNKDLQAGHWMGGSEDGFWANMFGHNEIRAIKDAAVASGVVEENRRWCAGNNPLIRKDSFPQSYRLANAYRTGEFELFDLGRKPCKPENHIDAASLGPLGMALVERLRLFELPEGVKPTSAWDAFGAFSLSAGDLDASRDSFGWRIHTTVNSLSGDLRRQLKSKTSQPLGSIDIRCCQPTILSGIIRFSKPQETHSANERRGGESGLGESGLLPPLICPLSFDKTPSEEELVPVEDLSLEWELSPFQRLCLEHDLYEHFRQQFASGRCAEPYPVYDEATGNVWTCKPALWDRDRVKGAFNVALFAPVEMMIANPVYRLMQLDYPEVARWLLHEKQNPRFLDGIPRDKAYKTTSQQCQRIEALAMIDGVAAEFVEAFPGEPIATIHDELIAPVERLGWLEENIRLEFAIRGIAVKTKTEIF